MNQIWTNPSAIKSQIVTTGIRSNLIECLKLSRLNTDTNTEVELILFPNMEYNFTFFDENTGEVCSIVGLVEKVYPDQVKIKYIEDFKFDKRRPPMDKHIDCCAINTSHQFKYKGPSILFIPIANIVSVSCLAANRKNDNGGLYIMVLGVCATVVTAVIVRLAFIDDNKEEAIKYVNLEAGKIYDISYEGRDGRIYENRAKVVSIEDCRFSHTSVNPGNGFVREPNLIEHTGFNNAVYIEDSRNKDEFMTGKPIKKGSIKIVVDTSEYFTGTYEVIYLDAIRDVTCVSDVDFDNADIEENS